MTCVAVNTTRKVLNLLVLQGSDQAGKVYEMRSFLFNLCYLALKTFRMCHSDLVEGDIAVPTTDDVTTFAKTKNTFVTDVNKLWSGGRIPYRFEEWELEDGGTEPLFSDEDKTLIKQALQHIMDNIPCIQFR